MYKNINEIKIEDLKKNYQMIHYFGLGFIQLKLSDTYRLHFYTDRINKILDEEEVHNHRYDFTSYVLKGKFNMKLFKTIEGNEFTIDDEDCQNHDGQEIVTDKKVETYGIQKISENNYSAGDSYWLEKDTFHRVKGDECITLLERGEVAKKYAQVLTPINKSKVCPFSKKIEEEELWKIVEEMLVA